MTLITQMSGIIRKLLHSCWKLVSPSHFHSIRNLKWTNHWAIMPLICPTAFKSERTTWELPKCQLNPPTFTASLRIIGGLNVPCNCYHQFGHVFPTFRAAICSHLDRVYLKRWPKIWTLGCGNSPSAFRVSQATVSCKFVPSSFIIIVPRPPPLNCHRFLSVSLWWQWWLASSRAR